MRLYDVFSQDEDPLEESQTADMRAFFAGADFNKPVPNVKQRVTPAEIKTLMTKMIQYGERSLTVDELSRVREYNLGKKLYGRRFEEGAEQQLNVQQLASISDEALDNAYHYGRSTPGNTFGWQANLKSAEFAAKLINAGETDIEKISNAIHQGWNVTAQAFVSNPEQFDDTEKLRAAGKLEAKLAQREKLMNIGYAQLPDDEQEKDRVVARALLQAIVGGGEQGVAEGSLNEGQYEMMMRNGQVKKFIAKDDTDAKRIAAGHGAKSVIRMKGNVPSDKIGEQGVAEGSEQVEAYGYRYNNRDQRVVWRKNFPSSEAAYAWADKHNATVIGVRAAEKAVDKSLNEFAPGDSGGDEKQYLLQLADELANAMYGPNKSALETKDIKNKIIAAGGDVKISHNNDTTFNVVMYHPTYFKQGHLIKLVGNEDPMDEAFRLGNKRLGNRRDRFKSIHRPSLVETEPTHRIGVTVTDPNHPMVSKRGETIQKSIRVTHADRDAAINRAIAHYRRKGYKVHDHHYMGTVEPGVAEDLSRRGFLKGAGVMAAGITAASGAHADEKSDPNKLTASMLMGGEYKELDLTPLIEKNNWAGTPKQVIIQADKWLSNFLRQRGNMYSNLKIKYKGITMTSSKIGDVDAPDAEFESVAGGSLNEFAPGSGGSESGRWYTDDEMTDIVGDGWWQDLDVSGANIGVIDSEVPKEYMIQQAQAWLDDQGYSVQVLNCRVNDDDMEWYIEGSFNNDNFAKKGVAEDQTDYQKRRQRERDVDAGKPVKPEPKNPQNDYFARRKKEKEQGVAEGSEKDMSKEVKAMATGKCPHCHGPVQKKEHPTLTQYHCAKCGIRGSIDKQGVAEGSGGNWYIRVNGKILNDTKFKPVIFSSEDEARSYAMKLADKKRIPLSQIKLTKSWMDAPEQGVAEAGTSAAVRLGRAIARTQGKTAASQARSVIPSSIPKKEEPKQDEKKVDEGIQAGDGFIIECGDSAIETVVLGNYLDGILIEFDHTATFMLIDAGITLTEAEYHGRTVPLGKRMAGDVKKSKVYVKKPNGNVVKVNFGDKNMTIKKHLPKHRKSYRARHHCENPGPKWKANYWSCRAW